VVERRPGVMPPKPGPPPRRVSRQRIVLRRVAAVAGVAVAALVVFGIVKVAGRDSASAPPATTAIVVPKPFRIIFPEGMTRADMAQRVEAVAKIATRKAHRKVRLAKAPYLAASRPRVIGGAFGAKKRSLEGFLFPATYDFLRPTTSAQLVRMQLDAFQANWSKVDLRAARKKNLTPYDVLIIASLVEKEGLAPDDRPKIARVIYNRLKAGMNLGIDATTRYGLHIPGTQSLLTSQIESNNPYNTRNPNITGLPPTPIANPGLASMQAAAHPAPGNWLYFVRKPDKVHHYFTANYDDFLNHAREYGFTP
jgi:peptidoglycan lytic transglycosylase G